MKTCNRLAVSTLIALCGACDISNDLGETASEGSAGGSGGTEDTGSVGAGSDSNSGSETGPGPGGESGMADSGDGDTGGEESGDDNTGGEDGSTGTPPGSCEPSDSYVRYPNQAWDLLDQIQEQFSDVDEDFAGFGTCDLTVGPAAMGKNGPAVPLSLSCVVDGTIGVTPLVQEALDLTVSLETDIDPSVLFAAFGNTVNARIVVSTPFNAYSWIVLEQPVPEDSGYPLLILNAAYSLEPPTEQTDGFVDGSWFGGPSLAQAEASCGPTELRCGTWPVALEAGWIDRTPVVVHAEERASFSSPLAGIGYDVYPGRMWTGDRIPCRDYPQEFYTFAVVATEL